MANGAGKCIMKELTEFDDGNECITFATGSPIDVAVAGGTGSEEDGDVIDILGTRRACAQRRKTLGD